MPPPIQVILYPNTAINVEFVQNTPFKVKIKEYPTQIIYPLPPNNIYGANIYATNAVYVGNSTVNVSINSTSFSGTSNNSIHFGNLTLANVQAQITGNAATAFSNAVSTSASGAALIYQTMAGLSANVATLTSNNSTNFGGLSLATVQGQITGNAATAYANAASYADSKAATAYSNAIIYSGNAVQAYTNATTFASNADNISSGTLNTARLPATVNIATLLNVGSNVNVNTSTIQIGNSTVNTVINSSSITTSIATIGNTNIIGDLVVSGNVLFNGPTTNVNSTNLVIEDKNIILGDVATPSDFTADGGGITLKGTTDKTLTWVDSIDAWTSSEDFNLVSGKSYEINGVVVVNSTSLGTGVLSSSLTSVGNLTTLNAGNTTITGFANVSSSLQVGGITTLNGNVAVQNYILANNASANNELLAGSDGSGFFFARGFNRAPNTLSIYIGGTTGNISFSTNGNEKLLIAANGNVGIGTSTPTQKIQIAGASQFDGIIFGGSGASGNLVLKSTSGNSNRSGIAIGEVIGSDNGGITFSVAGSSIETTAVRIQGTSGNVGIGNTAPSHKLSVAGDIYRGSSSTYNSLIDNSGFRVTVPSGAVSNLRLLQSGIADITINNEATTGFLVFSGQNTSEFRTATTAQTLKSYNTFTDASNYERLGINWTSNTLQILTERAGTGTSRDLQIGTAGTSDFYIRTNNTDRWRVTSAGHMLAHADNTYDIGASGATRPRNVYVANSISIGSSTLSGGTLSLGNSINLPNTGIIAWSSTSDPTATTDVRLFRDGAGILAQRDSTNAQALRVYDTYTDASNYERVVLSATENNLGFVGYEAAGTGSNRNFAVRGAQVLLQTGGSNNRWIVDGSGHFTAATDNTYDIGANGANRPRYIYVGTRMFAPDFYAASTGIFGIDTRLQIASSADGLARLMNWAGTDFNRLQFGGTTSSFPSLKRNGAEIDVRLADDSGYTSITAATIYAAQNFRAASNTSVISIGSSNDVVLARDGTGIFAQRDGAQAQTYRLYGTYTDSLNYERGILSWVGSTFYIGTQNAGTGSARQISFLIGGNETWRISTSNHLIAASDNTTDIGASGANRPRTLYLGTSLSIAGTSKIEATNGTLYLTELSGTLGGNSNYLKALGGTVGLTIGTNNADSLSIIGGSNPIVRFGGATSSFPAIKRSGSNIHFIVADDSFYTNVVAKSAVIVGGSLTTDLPVLDGAQTWNNIATTFTALKVNVTDTASSASSLLMDLQVGGSSKFSVRKDGYAIALSGMLANGTGLGYHGTGQVTAGSGGSFNFGSSGVNSPDVFLTRDAANTLAQRNGTNAQIFRIYNTYTDAGNYERAKIAWDTNVLKIGTEKAGTGSARALELQTDGTTWLTIATTGVATFAGSLSIQATGYFQFGTGRAALRSPADGILTLLNAAETDFNRLQFGGTTSSFPALKRSSTELQVRLADDSADAPFRAGSTTVSSLSVGANVIANATSLFVGNSTVNTVINSSSIVTTNLSGNGSSITSVDAATVGGNTASTLRSYSDTMAATAYSNAVAYAASNTYVNSTFLPLTGGTLNGNLTINASANVVSNLAANNVKFRGDVQIDGNLTVSGTTVTISANNLSLEDNMIYLNDGSTTSNPDLGFAGNYNDGSYKHAGFFRDATDGIWKVFDGYTPEPDASPYIDTSNASFRIANFQANVITANSLTGNGSNITTINADNISSGTLNTARLPATVNVVTVLNVGANVNVNTTTIFIGNSTVNTVINSSSISTGLVSLGNTTITGFANVSSTLQVSGNTTLSGVVQTISGNVNIDSGVLFVDATNNRVGINTTTPAEGFNASAATLIGGDNITSASLKLQRLNGGIRAIQHDFISTSNSPWYTHGINLTWTGERAGTVESTHAYKPYYEAAAPVNGIKEFGFVNATSGSFTGTSLIPNLVLVSNGNVGIGNTTPANKLSVLGTSYFDGAVNVASGSLTMSNGAITVSNTGSGSGTITISTANSSANSGVGTEYWRNRIYAGSDLAMVSGGRLFFQAAGGSWSTPYSFNTTANSNIVSSIGQMMHVTTVDARSNTSANGLYSGINVGFTANTATGASGNLHASVITTSWTESTWSGTANAAMLYSGYNGSSLVFRVNKDGDIWTSGNISSTTASFGNTTITGFANVSSTLQVTGNTTLSSNVTLSGALQTISGNVNIDSGVLFVDSVNDRVGIGNTAPLSKLVIQDAPTANDSSTFIVTPTWNATANTFTAVKVNATDTASNTNSMLMDLQVGGSSKFSIGKGGTTTSAPLIRATSSTAWIPATGAWAFGSTGNNPGLVVEGDLGIGLTSSGLFWWSNNTTGLYSTRDLVLARDAANTLALRNSTNAQAFRVYNTYTDASNYERGIVDWSTSANRFTVGTFALGTGTKRPMDLHGSSIQVKSLSSATTVTWEFSSSGHIIAGTDNTYDIGASGATRPRNLYVGTLITAPTITATGSVTAGAGSYLRTGNGNVQLGGPSDGVLLLYNASGNDFNRIQFGGTTSSFPALQRSGNELRVRLADDSGYTAIRVAEIGFSGATSSFPALKNSGTQLRARLADDSGFAPFASAEVTVNTNFVVNSEATTLATTTKTQVASFASASFRSGKLMVQAYDSVTGEVQISELLVAHNGTTASSTEYGVVFTGAAALATYDVDISAGNVRLMATRTTTNSTQYKTSEMLLIA